MCKYIRITVFHNIHKDKIELALLTNLYIHIYICIYVYSYTYTYTYTYTNTYTYYFAAFVVTVSAEDFVGYTASGKMDDEYIQSNKYIHDNSNNHSSSDKVPTLHPLSGMWFQQYWERECYRIGGNSYACPAMRAIDYVAHGLNEIRGNNDNNNNNNNDNTNNNNNNTNNNTNNTNNNNNNNNNNNTKKVSTTSYSSTTQGNGEGSTSRREAARTTTGVETEVGLPDNIFMGSLTQANLHECLPPFANTALVHALQHFARDIPGLLDDQSLLIGIETRTAKINVFCFVLKLFFLLLSSQMNHYVQLFRLEVIFPNDFVSNRLITSSSIFSQELLLPSASTAIPPPSNLSTRKDYIQ